MAENRFECDCSHKDETDAAPPPVPARKSLLPFPCNFPRQSHMRKCAERLETFANPNWPADRIRATSFEIACAGFYYLGDKDRVKCFYCDGGLQNWERNDNPWFEHAKWFPLCEFLLKKQGIAYVEKVTKTYPDLKRPVLKNPAKCHEVERYLEKKVQPSATFVDPRQILNQIKNKVDMEMTHGKNAKMAKSFGIPEYKLCYALTKQFERYGRNFDNLYDLLKALKHSPDEAEKQEGMMITPEQALATLHMERQCVICQKRERCILYLPCGHLVACEPCGRASSACPTCATGVLKQVKTYKA